MILRFLGLLGIVLIGVYFYGLWYLPIHYISGLGDIRKIPITGELLINIILLVIGVLTVIPLLFHGGFTCLSLLIVDD